MGFTVKIGFSHESCELDWTFGPHSQTRAYEHGDIVQTLPTLIYPYITCEARVSDAGGTYGGTPRCRQRLLVICE
jgi:hypothetical protein